MLFLTLKMGTAIAQTALPISPPNIQEGFFSLPAPGNIRDSNCLHPSNSNATSYGNLTTSNPISYFFDLYVSTWDPSIGIGQCDAGVLVREYLQGQKIVYSPLPPNFKEGFLSQQYGNFTYGNVHSLEAGILKEGGNSYIVLTYYLKWLVYPTPPPPNPNPESFSDFFVAIYKWNTDMNSPIGFTPYALYNLTGVKRADSGWIHQDVNSLNDIVITWQYHQGEIWTRAGEVTPNGLKLGETGKLKGLQGNNRQPDVAMLKRPNGDINLYYTFTSWDSTELYVYRGDFSGLYNLGGYTLVNPANYPWSFVPPMPSTIISATNFNVNLLYSKVFNGRLGLPRIDAPDNYPTTSDTDNVWAVVLPHHLPQRDEIFAVTPPIVPGDLFNEKVLNDGILIPNGDLTFSPTVYDYSARPEVAFSNNDSDLFFAWVYRNPNVLENIPLLQTGGVIGDDATYLSLKTTYDLKLINGYTPPQYYKLAASNHPLVSDAQKFYTGCSPSVALSTQNDASPYLYTSFLMMNSPIGNEYSIGLKTTYWNSAIGFKGISGLTDVQKEKQNLSIYPNPFSKSFGLSLKSDKGKWYSLTLTNPLGQKVFADKGTINTLNRDLKNLSPKIKNGFYFIELKSKKDKPSGKK